MQLELGTHVDCADGAFGKLADIVVDPTTARVTHLVVEPERGEWLARLVPIAFASPAADSVALALTREEVRRLPPAHNIALLRGGFPIEDPGWDVRVHEVLALPYYPTYEPEPEALDVALMYDRIPKDEVEIQRATTVISVDGHRLGHVDGFVVDHDGFITHLVLEHGHLWGRREVALPIGAVSRGDLDEVRLTLTKDEVGALPEVPVQRWPAPRRSDR